MRTRLRTALLGFALLASSPSPAHAGEVWVPDAVWKFTRGLVNVVTGLPGEILLHGLGTPTSDPGDTAGSYTTALLAGLATGVGYGVVRMGSGLVDLATFPVPFDDKNRPLLEPEFAL